MRLTETGGAIPGQMEIHLLLTLVPSRQKPSNAIMRSPLFPKAAREDFAVRSAWSWVSWHLAAVPVVGDGFEAGFEEEELQ